jgi:streptogramin lyase
MRLVHGGGSSRRRRLGPLVHRLLGLTIGLFGLLLVPSVASAIDEFPVGSRPGGITTGPDGALWFTEEGPPPPAQPVAAIGRFHPGTGAYTHFPIPGLVPDKITAGPDGRLWFTEFGSNRIGAIDTAGNITEYPNAGGSPGGIAAGPGGLWYTAQGSNTIRRIDVSGNIDLTYPITTPASEPSDIVFGPDGRLWFTEAHPSVNKIGALDPNIPPGPGAITEYSVGISPLSEPSGIISTTGGILWFTEPGINAIGRITTAGTVTEFPGAGVSASSIAAGRDGALWYTLGFSGIGVCTGEGDHAIGRITSAGSFTNKFATPTPSSDPSDITEGPDGALWFSEYCGDKIGRIVTGAPAPPPPPPPPPPVATLSVSSIKLSPSSFKAAPKGASITVKKRKAKTGTRVSYSLSRAASTKFTVERAQKGRKKGKKCVAPRPSNKKGKKCTRYVLAKGSFKHAGTGGKNKFKFSGRIGGKRLKPGTYRLIAVATAGATKSKLKRANFKIVR